MTTFRIHAIKQEIKKNLKISFPLVTSQLLYSSCGFFATVMLAHLGKVALAAVVLINMLWFALSVIFFGVLNAVSVLISHQYGAKQYAEVGKITGQSFLLSIVIILLILGILSAVPYVFRWEHQTPEIVALSVRYLHGMNYWIPALTFMIVMEQALIGLGKTRVVMFVSSILVPLQITFIYCFIFGKFGFPHVGVAGYGYGIALADTLGLLFLLIYVFCGKQFKEYQFFSHITLKSHYLMELVRVGLPMGVMSLIEVAAFLVMTLGIAHFGVTALAAHQIVLQFLGLCITIVFAMSQAITVRVGHALGAKQRNEINIAIFVGMGLNFFCMFLLAMLLFCFPHWLLHFDINIHAPRNQALVILVTELFRIVCFLMLFDNFRIIGFGALRGIKDTRFPMIASLIAFWGIGLTTSYLFGFYFDWKTPGVWMGMTLGIASGAVIVLIRIFHQLRQLDMEKILAIR